MPRMIFVNLPVKDLASSRGFFRALGFEFNEDFSDDRAACVVLADNIFVIVMIFGYFSVPPKYQHRVLFWGILGALIMRGAFIGMGALLIERFSWIMYIFGAFLVFTGIKMAMRQDEEFDAEKNIVRIENCRRIDFALG